MRAPALEMTLRGFLVDRFACNNSIGEYEGKRKHLQGLLDKLAISVWGKELNPNSPKQLQAFFFHALKLPEIVSYKKGVRKISTDRDALERLSAYMIARPFVNIILALRDCVKTLSVLHSGIDSDNRIRASYNVAGTETGRWSSNTNAFGTGTNLQNITPKLRHIFIADSGKKLAYLDLEQAESRAVGIIVWKLFKDSKYIDACESSDLHTLVCKMIWTQLPWTGQAIDKKKVAGQEFYRGFSYRDMAKRGGHGSNYGGQAPTMAKHLKVKPKLISDFQFKYFQAFPGIKSWHNHVAQTLQLTGKLTTILERQRIFFGRQSADETLREGIAYEPQSIVGDLLNLGLWRLWYKMGNKIEVIAQVHDAVVFQYDENLEDEIIPAAIDCLRTVMQIEGRDFSIPVEAMTGWNWAKAATNNPDGLVVYNGHDNRKRTEEYDTPILHRLIR